MTPEQVASIIKSELDGKHSVPNWHGVSLEKCLVNPVLTDLEDSFNDGNVVSMWLVLEERPDEKDGYKVVYDPVENEFGLATPGKNIPVFISYYGSFIETLAGM